MNAIGRTLRAGPPLWLHARHGLTRRYPPLSGRHHADVVIVGGGIVGALVAHEFAAAGISTILLEASKIGRGSTAASSALLLPEPDIELGELMKRYGPDAGRRIWQISHESVRALVRLLERATIHCDLARRDAVYCAVDADQAARLKAEYAIRCRAGFDGAWLGPGELRRLTGLAGQGAIRTSSSAQFDPYRAAVGLMRVAAGRGARVFEQSRVRRITTNADGVRLWTPHGMVESETVVIATGYATPQFRPLAGRFRMFRTYVCATEPVSTRQRRDLGMADVLLWDTARPYHYLRWAPGHRLLLGGGDRPVLPNGRVSQRFRSAVRDLRSYFEARLPALSGVRTEVAWEGLFATTPDTLPYIGPHRRYPRHWFALGYGGNGTTFGFLAARLLLERWRGDVTPDHTLFDFGRMRRL